MNRPLKFRCWHKGFVKGPPPTMLYDEKPGDCLRWKSDGQNIDHIMQFTGQKDKLGNDVYEGDIIECEYHDSTDRWRGVVKWLSWTTCGFSVIRADARGGTYSVGYSGSAIKRWEVIGNVFENPDLLKATAPMEGRES